jgi:hypothetical protein
MATAPHPLKTDPRIAVAWKEYLETCRQTANPISYEEVETWAWARLKKRLRRYELERQ